MSTAPSTTVTKAPTFAVTDAVSLLEDLLAQDRRLYTEVVTFPDHVVSLTGPSVLGPQVVVEVGTDAIESTHTELVFEARWVGYDAPEGLAPILGRFRVTVEKIEANA